MSELPKRIYIGAMNDALFIVDGPPHPAPYDGQIPNKNGPNALTKAFPPHCDTQLQSICDLYNSLADSAIPQSEADAMVAAARMAERTCVLVYLRERQSCGWTVEELADVIEEGKHRAKQSEEMRARDAVERAVQEAVEAERERCARISEALGDIGLTAAHEQYEEGHADACDRIAAAIRAPQEPSE